MVITLGPIINFRSKNWYQRQYDKFDFQWDNC